MMHGREETRGRIGQVIEREKAVDVNGLEEERGGRGI